MNEITPTPPISFRRQWLWLAAALAAIGLLIAYGSLRDRESIQAQEKERLAIQARVIDENLGHQLIGVSQALEGIQNDVDFWNRRANSKLASRHLQTLSAAMPGVRTFLVLDAHGNVLGSDHEELVGMNFRHREYFKVAQHHANPALVHVLPPFQTTLGVYAIVLARSVMDSAGNFAGVVTATLDPAYFGILLGSVRYASDMRISMNHGDGLIFLSVPSSPKRVNVNLSAPGSFFTQHKESGRDASVFVGRVYANGENRILALRNIAPAGVSMDKPLMVAVSREVDAVFAPWQQEVFMRGALFMLLVLGCGTSLYFRQRRQLAHLALAAQQESERVRREHDLRESERFLGTLVDVIPGMAGYWDAQLRCRFANDEFMRYFGRRPEEIRGIGMRELLGEDLYFQNEPHVRQALRGEEQHFERCRTRTDADTEYSWVHYLPDLDDGQVKGFFVLVTNITAMKQAQLQLEHLNRDLNLRSEQAEAALADYQRVDSELRILATAFESQQAIMITDAAGTILRVNRAFTETTGYSSREIVGQTPNVLRSGRHDDDFYRAMWDSLIHLGSWQGEIWDRRKSGEIFPSWTTITAVRDSQGKVTHYVSTQLDITSRKAAEEEIRHLAFYDPLTGLPNRRLLMERLRQARMNPDGCGGALMFIDLDNFKTLNDTLGHDKGDQLLEQVARRLPECVRETDTVARLGGDEFVVMLEQLSSAAQEAAGQAEAIGQKILEILNQPYWLAGQLYHTTASIGIALFADPDSSEELMKRADVAMYQAKSAGRNTLRFFDPQMQAQVAAHAALETELRLALQQQQFLLYYQPQVDGAGRITGAEALVRWQHGARGMISPAEFIPLAEKSGLIVPLGQWVLEKACRQLVAWSTRPRYADLSIAVNISARQFYRADFVEQVLVVLKETGANPHRLKLEITESLLFDDMEDIIGKMARLKAYGVGFSLDDFGIGYSSLSYLKRLPLDQLKIDQSFVRDVLTDLNDAAIARTIVALGKTLGLSVIAEGVETEAQRSFLADHSCFAYQGYLFSPPVPLDKFERLLEAEAPVLV